MLRTAFRSRVKLEYHLVSFFLSRHTHKKFRFCVAMISGMEHQKIFVQTRNESIETESVPFAFRFLMEASVLLGESRQKRHFYCYFNIRDN